MRGQPRPPLRPVHAQNGARCVHVRARVRGSSSDESRRPGSCSRRADKSGSAAQGGRLQLSVLPINPPSSSCLLSFFFFFPAVNGIIPQTRSFQGRWNVTLRISGAGAPTLQTGTAAGSDSTLSGSAGSLAYGANAAHTWREEPSRGPRQDLLLASTETARKKRSDTKSRHL